MNNISVRIHGFHTDIDVINTRNYYYSIYATQGPVL